MIVVLVVLIFAHVMLPYVVVDTYIAIVNLFELKFGFREHTNAYGLQEDFVADQLFQSSEHALDDLIWAYYSVFSSTKVLNYFMLELVNS